MSHIFRPEARKYLTKQQWAKLFLDQDGRCAGPCGRKLRPGDRPEADHKVSLENGGTNDIENWQILCQGCHALKTPTDRKQAAKTRAVVTSHVVPRGQGKRRGPPMPGSKASPWKFKLNGEREKR